MIPEYVFYHGALLHELINRAGGEVRIVPRDFYGRPDGYVINGKVGLLIKHSTARLTPWTFTFAKEHVSELLSLRHETRVCFVALICGEDGFVCIRDADLIRILTPTDSELISVRVDRRPRKMYGISCSGNVLDGKLARGVQDIVAEINNLGAAANAPMLTDVAVLLDGPKSS